MLEFVRDRLDANAGVFRNLLAGVSREQAVWKPEPEKWSLLEVVNHLADEERDDFRRRIDLTLHRPGEPWPPIDPPRWAVERRYNQRDLADSLEDFLAERTRSLEWLRRLGAVDMDVGYDHPTLGRLAVGDLLGAWVGHDLIHIRQMTRLHYQYAARRAAPSSLAYAGPW